MTREEAIKELKYIQSRMVEYAEGQTAMDMAIEALSAPTGGDLISRQAAIDAICKDWCNSKHKDCKTPFNQEIDEYYHCDGCGDIETLLALPTARPIRQTDALIIADALRYLEQDEERHEMDRATATSLRERILQYGASLSARPTGDVVEVVRCKDCKHRDPEDKKCDCGHDILWQLPRPDDWFCGDAEMEVEHE